MTISKLSSPIYNKKNTVENLKREFLFYFSKKRSFLKNVYYIILSEREYFFKGVRYEIFC